MITTYSIPAGYGRTLKIVKAEGVPTWTELVGEKRDFRLILRREEDNVLRTGSICSPDDVVARRVYEVA